jgi:hypothetical protein
MNTYTVQIQENKSQLISAMSIQRKSGRVNIGTKRAFKKRRKSSCQSKEGRKKHEISSLNDNLTFQDLKKPGQVLKAQTRLIILLATMVKIFNFK